MPMWGAYLPGTPSYLLAGGAAAPAAKGEASEAADRRPIPYSYLPPVPEMVQSLGTCRKLRDGHSHFMCRPLVDVVAPKGRLDARVSAKIAAHFQPLGTIRRYGTTAGAPPLFELSPKITDAFRERLLADPANRRLQNALRAMDAHELALDSRLARPDHVVTSKLTPKNEPRVLNQMASGRCWLFSAHNAIRYAAAANLDVESSTVSFDRGVQFSNVYLWFYHLLELANTFLERVIDMAHAPTDYHMLTRLLENPVETGGNYPGFQQLYAKYGTVPDVVMPETTASAGEAEMVKLLKAKLRQGAAQIRVLARRGAKPAGAAEGAREEGEAQPHEGDEGYGKPLPPGAQPEEPEEGSGPAENEERTQEDGAEGGEGVLLRRSGGGGDGDGGDRGRSAVAAVEAAAGVRLERRAQRRRTRSGAASLLQVTEEEEEDGEAEEEDVLDEEDEEEDDEDEEEEEPRDGEEEAEDWEPLGEAEAEGAPSATALPPATVEELEALKQQLMSETYRLLALHLGTPPQTFSWAVRSADGRTRVWKDFTPKQFAHEFIGRWYKPSHKVYVQHDPRHAYDTLWASSERGEFATTRQRWLNVDAEDMLEWTVRSVLDGEPVWFGCDVRKESELRFSGVLHHGLFDWKSAVGVELKLNKSMRLEMGMSSSTHAMLINGVDLTEPTDAATAAELDGASLLRRVRRLRIENSWGADLGDIGHQTMTTEWFREWVYHVAVDARYLPKRTLGALKQKPRELPPWDPMASHGGCQRVGRGGQPEENAAYFGRPGVGWATSAF